MNLLHNYQNNNYMVSLYDDGSKVRTYTEKPNPNYPESADIKITDFCDLNCVFCFLPDTLVNMADGTSKPISTIKSGDKVFSYNEETGEIVVDTVGMLYQHTLSEEIICLTLENDDTINVTSNHEVMTQRGWVSAGELTIEDEIIDINM